MQTRPRMEDFQWPWAWPPKQTRLAIYLQTIGLKVNLLSRAWATFEFGFETKGTSSSKQKVFGFGFESFWFGI